jgi:hypothetical protein
MKRKLGRMIAYGIAVGGLLAGSFVCYGIANYQRGIYAETGPKIYSAETEEEKAELQAKMDEANQIHMVVGTTAYVLSIASLAALGVCLHISDKLKEKEEKIPGLN